GWGPPHANTRHPVESHPREERDHNKKQKRAATPPVKNPKPKTALPAAGTARRPLHSHGKTTKESKAQQDKRSRNARVIRPTAQPVQERERSGTKEQRDTARQKQIVGIPTEFENPGSSYATHPAIDEETSHDPPSKSSHMDPSGDPPHRSPPACP